MIPVQWGIRTFIPILKVQAETISQALVNLLENSCKMSRVRRLKKSQQTTYLYEGVREEPGNYQPDSLTLSLEKYWNR